MPPKGWPEHRRGGGGGNEVTRPPRSYLRFIIFTKSRPLCYPPLCHLPSAILLPSVIPLPSDILLPSAIPPSVFSSPQIRNYRRHVSGIARERYLAVGILPGLNGHRR